MTKTTGKMTLTINANAYGALLAQYQPKIITTEKENERALSIVESLAHKSNLTPDAYYALGSIYVEESKYEEAIDNFKKVIELGKSDLAGTASIAIADIYTKEDKIDLAIRMYKDAAEE